MPLTETWLKQNNGKIREKTEEFADRDAMSVRVSPKGKIVYQLRYRFNGKPNRLDLGSYPLMSLKDARAESQRLRALLEQGRDPKVERRVERQAIIEADTVKELFHKWYESYCIENKKSHREILRSFDLYVFPVIGDLPAGRVTLQQWLEILESRAKKSKAIAERILINAKQMLKWAVKRRIITENVLVQIYAKEDLGVEKRSTDRVLTVEEIRLMWLAINESRMEPKNKLFVKLCLVFGCRNGELRVAKKSHFDFEAMTWTVPPENHKTGEQSRKPIVRPIVPFAEDLIRQAMRLSNSDYLFTNSGNDQPLSKSAPLAFPYNIMQYLRRHHNYEMAHWSIHDLRRTMRTNISAFVPMSIAEIMLGHVQPRIVATYDKFDYLDAQREGYQQWVDQLVEILGDQAA